MIGGTTGESATLTLKEKMALHFGLESSETARTRAVDRVESDARREPIPREHAGKRIGGKNLSPPLTWSAPPPETTELLLVVEDLDVPQSNPAVHCLVLIDPSRLDSSNHLPQGALAAREPAAGVAGPLGNARF